MLKVRTAYPRTRGLALSALFATLLGIFSIVSIPLPFSPVPITLQVFIIFLIVNLLGSYYGSLACLVYLLFGLGGLPVFAGATGGPGVLFGPLGGYLFAFPVSAFLGGLVSGLVSNSKKKDLVRVTLASAISLVLIYLMGPIWLSVLTGMGLEQAFLIGAVPFIPVDIAKAVLAIPLASYFRRGRVDLPVHRTS